jgi:hypothetical protein
MPKINMSSSAVVPKPENEMGIKIIYTKLQ